MPSTPLRTVFLFQGSINDEKRGGLIANNEGFALRIEWKSRLIGMHDETIGVSVTLALIVAFRIIAIPSYLNRDPFVLFMHGCTFFFCVCYLFSLKGRNNRNLINNRSN